MEEVKVWFPSAEPSPLPLKGKTFKQNFPKWYILCFICERFHGVYETYMAHPTSLSSITVTKTDRCVEVWSRLLVHLYIVCSFVIIHQVWTNSINVMPIGQNFCNFFSAIECQINSLWRLLWSFYVGQNVSIPQVIGNYLTAQNVISNRITRSG